MSRFSCLLLVSQALVAFSAPTFQLAPRGLSVLPLGDGITPQVLTLRENIARRENAARYVVSRNKKEEKATEEKQGAAKKAAKGAKNGAEGAAKEAAANGTAVSLRGLPDNRQHPIALY